MRPWSRPSRDQPTLQALQALGISSERSRASMQNAVVTASEPCPMQPTTPNCLGGSPHGGNSGQLPSFSCEARTDSAQQVASVRSSGQLNAKKQRPQQPFRRGPGSVHVGITVQIRVLASTRPPHDIQSHVRASKIIEKPSSASGVDRYRVVSVRRRLTYSMTWSIMSSM